MKEKLEIDLLEDVVTALKFGQENFNPQFIMVDGAVYKITDLASFSEFMNRFLNIDTHLLNNEFLGSITNKNTEELGFKFDHKVPSPPQSLVASNSDTESGYIKDKSTSPSGSATTSPANSTDDVQRPNTPAPRVDTPVPLDLYHELFNTAARIPPDEFGRLLKGAQRDSSSSSGSYEGGYEEIRSLWSVVELVIALERYDEIESSNLKFIGLYGATLNFDDVSKFKALVKELVEHKDVHDSVSCDEVLKEMYLADKPGFTTRYNVVIDVSDCKDGWDLFDGVEGVARARTQLPTSQRSLRREFNDDDDDGSLSSSGSYDDIEDVRRILAEYNKTKTTDHMASTSMPANDTDAALCAKNAAFVRQVLSEKQVGRTK